MIKLLVALDHNGITVPEGSVLNLGEREETLVRAGSAEKYNPSENIEESLEEDSNKSIDSDTEAKSEEVINDGGTSDVEHTESIEPGEEISDKETPKVTGRSAKIK